ncbi:Nn.00g090520.m01.CDS01 [Neocucurbitaria sp. VM-36]
MSLDSILEGLKQGNALEMEFIKQLKEGLDFITDGMQSECFKRSDALSDAKERLETERGKGHGYITAEQKALVASLIKMNILKHEEAIKLGKHRREKAIHDAEREFQAETQSVEHAMMKSQEEKQKLNNLADIIDGIKNGRAANGLRDIMGIWEQRKALLQAEYVQIQNRWDKRFKAAYSTEKDTREVADDQIRALKSIAQAAGIDPTDL